MIQGGGTDLILGIIMLCVLPALPALVGKSKRKG